MVFCTVAEVRRKIEQPGEIRKEYEIQKAKEELEQRKIHEAEAKASEAYIQKLREEEERERVVKEKNVQLSEQVARQLELEVYDPGPSTSKTIPSAILSGKKQSTLDSMFLTKASRKNMMLKDYSKKEKCESNDSIDSECRYFKPIPVRMAPSKRKPPVIRVPAVVATASTVIIG